MQLDFWTEACRPRKSPGKRLHKTYIIYPTPNLLPCPFPLLTSFRITSIAVAKQMHLGQEPDKPLYCFSPFSILYLICCKFLLSKVLALVNLIATTAAETKVDGMDEY